MLTQFSFSTLFVCVFFFSLLLVVLLLLIHYVNNKSKLAIASKIIGNSLANSMELINVLPFMWRNKCVSLCRTKKTHTHTQMSRDRAEKTEKERKSFTFMRIVNWQLFVFCVHHTTSHSPHSFTIHKWVSICSLFFYWVN